MKILGIHSLGHDTGLTLIENGKVIYSHETERLTRVKHDSRIEVLFQYVNERLPHLLRGVDVVAFSTNVNHNFACIERGASLESAIGEHCLHVEGKTTLLSKSTKCLIVAHEAAHAMTSMQLAGYPDQMIILVNEGRGTFSRNSVLKANNCLPSVIRTDSLPWFGTGFGWTAMGLVLGFPKSPSAAGSVMALGAYGSRNDAIEAVLRTIPCDVHYRSRSEQDQHASALVALLDRQGHRASYDLVFVFQRMFSEAVSSLVRDSLLGTDIGLSGGCALNLYTNTELRYQIEAQLHIPPTCGDAGQSLGAALYAHVVETGSPVSPYSVYQIGESVGNEEAREAAYREGWRIQTASPREIAKLLTKGEIIAICSGKGEQGPRALGHRSLLASTTIPGMRHRLSIRLKARQWFRPLGCCMRAETFKSVFPNEFDSPYMLFSYLAASQPLAEARHVDGSSRIQTVEKTDDPFLWSVLEEYERESGEIALVNTSLNGPTKAIVGNLKDVFEDFRGTELAYVVAGDILLSRSRVSDRISYVPNG